jgi:type I restriction enzyme S subunit
LSKLQIPLPPIGEQRRIAAILDRAETLRAKRRHALAKLDSLVSETFFERFMSRIQDPAVNVLRTALSNPDGWKWAKLTDVARLATGHTPDRKRPDYWNGSISWISLTDIRELDGTIAQRTSESVSELGIAHSSSVKLPEGTVCFSRTASVGFVTIMGTEMATSQDFVNWVCGPDLDPIFLMHALLASRPTLLSLANGSTHRTIYLRTVEEFRCIVPPIKEQRQFREAVSSISKIRRHMANSLLLLNKNFASLQHRAFRGEL